MEKRRIILYGSSIIVGSIGVSLKQSGQFEVIPLLPAQQADIEAHEPNAVIFDLEAARPEAAFTLLEKHPDMTLIGVSPDSNLVMVWSGKQLQELSTRDLMGLMMDG